MRNALESIAIARSGKKVNGNPFNNFHDLGKAELYVQRLLRSYEEYKKDLEDIEVWGVWFAGAILAIDSSQ